MLTKMARGLNLEPLDLRHEAGVLLLEVGALALEESELAVKVVHLSLEAVHIFLLFASTLLRGNLEEVKILKLRHLLFPTTYEYDQAPNLKCPFDQIKSPYS